MNQWFELRGWVRVRDDVDPEISAINIERDSEVWRNVFDAIAGIAADVDGLELVRPGIRGARARRTDPETSHEAAASITEDQLRASQAAVLKLFREERARVWGLTDEELVDLYDGPKQSPSGLRTRRKELAKQGFIYKTGKRRKTKGKRNADVWAVR